MKKSVLIIIFCLVLTFCFSACGGGGNIASSDPSAVSDFVGTASVPSTTSGAEVSDTLSTQSGVASSSTSVSSSVISSSVVSSSVVSSSVVSSSVVSSSVVSSSVVSNTHDSPTLSKARELLGAMSLEEKIAQLFIVEPEALLNASWGVSQYNGQEFTYPVGGVIFFAGNIKTPQQTTDFITDLQSASKVPLFIAVDEEGGNVARIGSNKNMGTTAFSPMFNIKTEEKAYNVGRTIGNDIKQFGFNLDLAPVADVANPDNLKLMSGRSFGTDVNEVSKLLASCVKGFKDSEMLCTLKHFPGKGFSTADSHYSYSELNKTLEEWRETEKKPFVAGINAGADFIMAGHYAMPKVTGDRIPASLSPKLIKMLREELDYDGLIMTDSLQMGAIIDDYNANEVGVKVLEADIDIILMPENLSKTFQGIRNAVHSGRLTEERIDKSVLKILELKIKNGIIK